MTGPLRYEVLRGEDAAPVLDDVARLRVAVFREWPYLYDGDLDYERRYLESYAAPGVVVVIALFEDRVVGAATGMPLKGHAESVANAFANHEFHTNELFYCAESVLLPQFRGQGAGRVFFTERESEAIRQGFRYSTFCAVVRPEVNSSPDALDAGATGGDPQGRATYPQPPSDYRSLEPFWRSIGYRPLNGVVARLSWRDIGMDSETEKELAFWAKEL